MAQKLITCEHCEGAKVCKFDHGKSCETCRMAAGAGRKGGPKNVRCSFCQGHGRVWIEVAEEPEAEAAPDESTD